LVVGRHELRKNEGGVEDPALAAIFRK